MKEQDTLQPDLDQSELARVRATVEIVNGNGRRGLAARVSLLELCGWIIATAIAGLWLEGRVWFAVGADQKPAIHRVDNGPAPLQQPSSDS